MGGWRHKYLKVAWDAQDTGEDAPMSSCLHMRAWTPNACGQALPCGCPEEMVLVVLAAVCFCEASSSRSTGERKSVRLNFVRAWATITFMLNFALWSSLLYLLC